MDPQIAPQGSKYAKIARKLRNFKVLELQQVTDGSDKVVFVTKKFYLDVMKIVCDKIFFQDPFKVFHYKNHPEEKFGILMHVTLLSKADVANQFYH